MKSRRERREESGIISHALLIPVLADVEVPLPG